MNREMINLLGFFNKWKTTIQLHFQAHALPHFIRQLYVLHFHYLSITTQRHQAHKKAGIDAARRTFYKYTFFIEIALIKTIPSLWMRKKYNVNVINKESSIIFVPFEESANDLKATVLALPEWLWDGKSFC